MMNVNEIQGFHIEPTNMCTLKCPGCARTQFIEQWPNHWRNQNLNIDDLLNFLDIDINGKDIMLCGNNGDPIYHPDFLTFVEKLKQRGTRLTIHTNGSYKTKSWWEQLVSLMDNQDKIYFSVDGTPENFIQYRINGDWNTIQTAMKVVANSDVYGVWKYIPFNYNINTVEDAKIICKDIGLDEFECRLSPRFDAQEMISFMPDNENFIDDRLIARTRNETTVIPKCHDNKTHYISADGFYVSCCWIGDYRSLYQSIFGKNRKDFDIRKTTISHLFNDKQLTDFYESVNSQSLCKFHCPKTVNTL